MYCASIYNYRVIGLIISRVDYLTLSAVYKTNKRRQLIRTESPPLPHIFAFSDGLDEASRAGNERAAAAPHVPTDSSNSCAVMPPWGSSRVRVPDIDRQYPEAKL